MGEPVKSQKPEPYQSDLKERFLASPSSKEYGLAELYEGPNALPNAVLQKAELHMMLMGATYLNGTTGRNYIKTIHPDEVFRPVMLPNSGEEVPVLWHVASVTTTPNITRFDLKSLRSKTAFAQGAAVGGLARELLPLNINYIQWGLAKSEIMYSEAKAKVVGSDDKEKILATTLYELDQYTGRLQKAYNIPDYVVETIEAIQNGTLTPPGQQSKAMRAAVEAYAKGASEGTTIPYSKADADKGTTIPR